VRPAVRPKEGRNMEIWIAGIATLGLTVYLLYALIRPEQF